MKNFNELKRQVEARPGARARLARHREKLTISERYHERMFNLVRRKSTRVSKNSGQ